MKLVYDVNDRPKFNKMLVFALQQVLAIMAATIAVPSIVGLDTRSPAAILGAGVGTIVYLLFTKFKSPVFLGSSFAFLNSLGVALAYGYCGVIVGSIFAGLVYVIIAVIIHFAGTKWVGKLMPPVIIGPTVAVIGLSLAGNAMGDMVKASAAAVNGDYNLIGLLCGLVTFFVVIICSVQKKYKMMKLIPFIIGIGAGYALATIFTGIGIATGVEYLKVIDWSPLVKNFEVVTVQSFLNYPDFALIEAIKEMVTGQSSIEGAQILNGAGVAEAALAFLPVALVVFAEHIADHKNLSSIIDKDLVEGEPGLKRTLLGDGVGSIAGTILGVCPNTTYGESVGCVAITRNASIITIFTAAIMWIVLSFSSPRMCLLQTIPACVMGGVCLTLYGFIACSGLKMFKNIDLGENKNLFTVSAILIAGIGGLAIKIPYELSTSEVIKETFVNGILEDTNIVVVPVGTVSKAITITSVATALILGIITYAVCNKLEKKDGAVEEEIENKSIVTEAAVQVGVVDTLVQTEEAAAEEVAEEVAAETIEEN